jgi:hypothetical protein
VCFRAGMASLQRPCWASSKAFSVEIAGAVEGGTEVFGCCAMTGKVAGRKAKRADRNGIPNFFNIYLHAVLVATGSSRRLSGIKPLLQSIVATK